MPFSLSSHASFSLTNESNERLVTRSSYATSESSVPGKFQPLSFSKEEISSVSSHPQHASSHQPQISSLPRAVVTRPNSLPIGSRKKSFL